MKKTVLALEDGTVFEGRSFGASRDSSGEVVFNTAITGYQEIFTDPSYAGQIVVLTNPQIGNYGANHWDSEAPKPFIEGLVVREFSPVASNWRSEEAADQFLSRSGIPIAAEIDTRALVRHLRSRGVMRGVLATSNLDPLALVQRARAIPSMAGLDLATRVTADAPYQWDKPVGCLLSRRRRRRPGGAPLPRRRVRFRHQAEYPAAAGAGRMSRDGGARQYNRGGRAGAESRRHLSLKRTRRSRAARISATSRCESSSARSRSSAFVLGSRCWDSRSAARRTSSSSGTAAPITPC